MGFMMSPGKYDGTYHQSHENAAMPGTQ